MPQFIEIHFGDVFKVRDCPERIDVITDVGENEWFAANKMLKDDEGKEYLSHGHGTAGMDLVEEIIGRWSHQEVLAGLRTGYQKVGLRKKAIAELVEITRQASVRVSRLIAIE